MKLSVESLQQAGAFTGAPVEKEIKWTQGEDELTATVFVRRLSYASAVEEVKAMAGRTDRLAGRIASAICDEEGKPIFTAADITGDADPDRGPLDHNLTMALLAVIGEVNSLGKTKRSPTKTKSGTNSSSTESEGEQSPKPRKKSATPSSADGSSTGESEEASTGE